MPCSCRFSSGRRLNGVQEVGGSNPLAPIHLCGRNALQSANIRQGRVTKTPSSRGGDGCLLLGYSTLCLALTNTVTRDFSLDFLAVSVVGRIVRAAVRTACDVVMAIQGHRQGP